jgi:hypothetical protein
MTDYRQTPVPITKFERSSHKFFGVNLLNLKTQMIVNLRTVDGFMAARAPAGSTGKERRVILARDVNMAVGGLLLEMAAQTKRGVARDQHPGIHGTVRIVAHGAAFAHGLVLKNERSELPRVALGAGFILGHKFRAAAHNHGTFVWTMAIAATDPPFKNGMMRRQMKFSLFVQVTLETHLR